MRTCAAVLACILAALAVAPSAGAARSVLQGAETLFKGVIYQLPPGETIGPFSGVPAGDDTVAVTIDQLTIRGKATVNQNNFNAFVKLELGGSGVGETSGAPYKLKAVGQLSINGALDFAPIRATLVLNGKLLGKGSAPDLKVHANLHLTVNANGDITALVCNIKISGVELPIDICDIVDGIVG